MPTFEASRAGYRVLWGKCQVEKTAEAASVAKKIIANRTRYETAGRSIGHPQLWPVIGAIHNRESSLNFDTQLAQGDPLNAVSTHVPKGRGPFPTWEAGAEDALRLQGWNNISGWPLERWLYESEAYNGWGYTNHGINSPYVWGGTKPTAARKVYRRWPVELYGSRQPTRRCRRTESHICFYSRSKPRRGKNRADAAASAASTATAQLPLDRSRRLIRMLKSFSASSDLIPENRTATSVPIRRRLLCISSDAKGLTIDGVVGS